MDITNEQIEQEFRRQVRLCGGIGAKRMVEIIRESGIHDASILDQLSPLPQAQDARPKLPSGKRRWR